MNLLATAPASAEARGFLLRLNCWTSQLPESSPQTLVGGPGVTLSQVKMLPSPCDEAR